MAARFLPAAVWLAVGAGVLAPGLAAAEGTPSPSAPSGPTPSEPSSSGGNAPTSLSSPLATSPSRSWYGWQILGLDVASIAIMVAAVPVASQNSAAGDGVALVGGMGYLAGGPSVHLGREQRGKAAASIALRLLAPATAGGIGALILLSMYNRPPPNSDAIDFGPGFDAAVGFVLGAAVGMVVASVIDVSALAWAAPASPSAPNAARPTWLVVPTVYSISDVARRSDPAFGFAGRF